MKIRETFENRKKNGQKALVTYIVSGDYGYETTKENIRAMVKAGADVIEIGIPFSDPIAEGVVIQEASQHSLAGGTTLTIAAIAIQITVIKNFFICYFPLNPQKCFVVSVNIIILYNFFRLNTIANIIFVI